MASPWLIVGPEVAYWGVRQVSELWGPKVLYISENGASADDPVQNGRIDDADRVMYLRNYITSFHRAVAEGYPLKGYFLWSLMDNFEWADGYSKRFGIHYVDFATQKRTPKLSAAWYKEVIKRNAVVSNQKLRTPQVNSTRPAAKALSASGSNRMSDLLIAQCDSPHAPRKTAPQRTPVRRRSEVAPSRRCGRR